MTPAISSPDDASTTAFDRRAYGHFSLPRSLASAMAGLDDPVIVAGSEARHLREDDLVIGVAVPHEDSVIARAYPIWIVDHYHVVNDRIGGRRVVITSCERCQTGSAFVADPPGGDREPLFRAGGVFCATLMMSDLRGGSIWNHYDGRAVRGRAASVGARLPWLPTIVTEWHEWRSLHPGSEVIGAPDDPRHPDARHGHGREELFCRPGIDPAFVPTIVGPLDDRYPEHELVLGVDDGDPRAYPLREVQREGGVVHDRGVVVLAGPDPAASAMRAFAAPSTLGELTRNDLGDAFIDRTSGSTWTIEGIAIDGPMAGTILEPVRSYTLRWHAWVYARRRTSLFVGTARPATVPEARTRFGAERIGALDSVLAGFEAIGVRVEVEGPVARQLRPRSTAASLRVRLDSSQVLLHLFADGSAARDVEALEGAWACDPFATRMLARRCVRVGPVLAQADPWPRFADPAQLVPLPETELAWPGALDRLAEAVPAELLGSPATGVAFIDVIRGLRAKGYEVLEPGFLPPAQLMPGCLDAIALTVEADRFLLYRFGDEHGAHEAARAVPTGHALAVGGFVARSTPDTMYRHQAYEIEYAGDAIRWSPLLDDERFVHALRETCAPTVTTPTPAAPTSRAPTPQEEPT